MNFKNCCLENELTVHDNGCSMWWVCKKCGANFDSVDVMAMEIEKLTADNKNLVELCKVKDERIRNLIRTIKDSE